MELRELGVPNLSHLSQARLRFLRAMKIYQTCTTDYDVDQIFHDWFSKFKELERDDMLKALPEKQRDLLRKILAQS